MERCSCFGRIRGSSAGTSAARPRRTARRVRRLAALVVVRKQSGVALRLPPHQGSGWSRRPRAAFVCASLALGYDEPALQAGCAALFVTGKRGSGVRGQAKRDTAFPQGDKRSAAPPDVPPRPPPRCARCRPQTERCRASLAPALQKSCCPGDEHFSRSRSLHGRVVMGSRVVWHGEEIGRTAQHSQSYRPGSHSVGIVALASPGGSRITVSAALGSRPG